jgi:YHS domain-containing protein
VVFQTHLVTVELRDSRGHLIKDSGATVVWRPYGSNTFVPFGTGLLDTTGQIQMEVLPLEHKYGLTYQGATQYLCSRATTVVFQTHLVTVELRDSRGHWIVNSGATVVWRPYGSNTFVPFGTGVLLHGVGRISMEVLPLEHKYGLTYQGATQYQCSGAETVVFQTHLVTVELRDSLGNLIEHSGATVSWRPYGSSTFVPFGASRLDAAGQVQMEVLPLEHKYGLTYQGATQYQYSSAATVVFRTRLVTVELRDSLGSLIPDSGATIVWRPYGSSTFTAFGAGMLDAAGQVQMEVLPLEHKYGLTYQGATQYQCTSAATVVFRTRRVTVELRDSLGNLIPNSGATVVWRPCGLTAFTPFGTGMLDAAGQVQMEVLPLEHRYGLKYQGATQYLYSSAATVVFRTRQVTVELRNSLGDLIPDSGSAVVWRPYGSSTFAPFGAGMLDAAGQVRMEVLPLEHRYGLTYRGATQYLCSSAATLVFQTHLVTVELRDSQGQLIVNSGALVAWRPGDAGPYVPFGDGILDGTGRESLEVLPLSHRFRLTYLGKTRQQADDDSLLLFYAEDFH